MPDTTPVIVGASGYLGSRLVADIQRESRKGFIRVIRGNRKQALRLIPYWPPAYLPGQEIQFQDLVDSQSFCVLHLGGPSIATQHIGREEYTQAVQITEELSQWCLRGNANLHLLSSTLVYGTDEGRVLDEKVEPTPDTPYAQLKLRLESIVSSSGVPGATVRLSNVYGPYMPRHVIVSRILRRIGGETSAFTPYSAGLLERRLDLVHETDVKLMLRKLEELSSKSRLVGVFGSGRAGTPSNLYRHVITSLENGTWNFTDFVAGAGAVQSTWADDHLALTARIPIERGVQSLLLGHGRK